MEQLLTEENVRFVVGYGTKIVGTLVALFLAWIVAGWVRRLVAAACTKAKIEPTLGKFFANAGRYLVITLSVVACLGIFGIETTSFAAVIGAAGLAIGLAFQGSLSNLAAGVMLLLFRPFKVGDVISVSGSTGKIEEIELFTTKMITPDNRMIILPNKNVFGSTIENVTALDIRRVDVAVGTDYGADLAETRKILEDTAKKIHKLEEKDPQVYLVELGGSSIDWSVRVWAKTADYWGVREELTFAVKVALDEAKVGIPFPQMDVHFDSEVVQAFPRAHSA